jgi:hypothetical protein
MFPYEAQSLKNFTLELRKSLILRPVVWNVVFDTLLNWPGNADIRIHLNEFLVIP